MPALPSSRLHRPLLLLALLAPLLALAGAPADGGAPEARLPGPGLLADVDLLQQAFQALHPGLYRSLTPEQAQAQFDLLRGTLGGGATLPEAFLAFSRFAAQVRCGHTFLNFTNQSKAVRAALLEAPDRVPFHFRWLDRRMVITRNFSTDPGLVPGTEVLSIQGVPVGEVLARLLTIARADGGNDAKRIASLQVQGEDRHETFDVYLPLLFPRVGRRQTFEVRAPGQARARTTTVPALTYAQRLAGRPGPAASPAGPAWTLSFPEPGLAVLRMPTWALYDSPWEWRRFLQESFTRLAERKVPALVIDLRGNEGGLSVGDELLAHLVDADLRQLEVRRLVRYRRVPAALEPFLDTWDPSFKDWGDQALPVADREGFFRLTRYDDPAGGDVVHPAAPRYQGRVAVLVGAANSSATFEFARQVQASRLGLLVGQPTGGNLRGINGGAFFFLRLPASGLELDLPLIGQFPPGEFPDSGLTPDLVVTPSLEDVARGRDPELAAARLALRR